ncbi:DUF4932 domain-containing protein [Maribacter sp. 4G9]|uniref:DUF4932 domain-containing protein n=1 Tax=Maribacter sp. 4G9 TaxID=1889777 RepID=UPI000C1479AB|nr:DUF4932 domain-containing protein [Maribacter sp. 4G9]PIB30616.1 hypothetical protein BFP75_02470 [Maribacter sp. 4G9]
MKLKIFIIFISVVSILSCNDKLNQEKTIVSKKRVSDLLTGQNLDSEMIYPDTLKSAKDTFFLRGYISPEFEFKKSYLIKKNDTVNQGTSGVEGAYYTIWSDLDTIKIPHVNYPFRQLVKIPIVSPKDTTLCILRFQPSTSNFSDSYVTEHKGKFVFDIPEVYELANIILYLSECSKKTKNHPENTEYVKKLEKHFAPFKNHKLIQILNKQCSKSDFWETYYGFRENSLAFKFNEEYLEYDTPYKHLWQDSSEIWGGQFRNLLYLLQDFANQSYFRDFYKENLDYYERLIKRESKLLPIEKMWRWLEREFPQRMDSYKIVFSPLIGGSHSTQKFQKGFYRNPEFQECIMFINSAESLDSNLDYSEELKEGLMSGIVFTEIDHNYVNPTSDEYVQEIKLLLRNKDNWATKEAQQNYNSEYAIFNEYMTHSLFCLYVMESCSEELANLIVDKRIKLMERRGFPKFMEFNNRLIEQSKNNDLTLYESYGSLIASMEALK